MSGGTGWTAFSTAAWRPSPGSLWTAWGPFSLNRFARETRANHYAPLGARRRSGVGPVWRGDCKSRTSVGPFPRWFFLLIYRGLLAPFVRLRWRCYPLWPSALADMASRMVRTPRR